MYYLSTFIFYSILGHLIESLFFIIIKANKKSGFLFLWWTPLYGFGAVISLIIYNFISKKIKNNFWKNIVLLMFYFVAFTLLEMIGGFLIEKIFNYEMWNYTNVFWHFNKYASVPTSFLWSIMALVYVYKFKNITDVFVKRFPKLLSIILTIIFIIDCVLSIMKAFY